MLQHYYTRTYDFHMPAKGYDGIARLYTVAYSTRVGSRTPDFSKSLPVSWRDDGPSPFTISPTASCGRRATYFRESAFQICTFILVIEHFPLDNCLERTKMGEMN